MRSSTQRKLAKTEGWKEKSTGEQWTQTQQLMHTSITTLNQITTSLFQGANSIVEAQKNILQADAATKKAFQTRLEGAANALQTYINTLTGVLNQTAQKTIEEAKEAQKMLESVLNLIKEMDKSVSQIYQQ